MVQLCSRAERVLSGYPIQRIVEVPGTGFRVAAGYSLFESSDNYFGYNSVGIRLGIIHLSDFTSCFESNDLDVHLDGGTISSSVVWGASSEYSMVTGGDVVVAAGASPKVMPGTVIKLRQNNRIPSYGHLEAAGQESAPIYFTDFRNDLVGGTQTETAKPPFLQAAGGAA